MGSMKPTPIILPSAMRFLKYMAFLGFVKWRVPHHSLISSDIASLKISRSRKLSGRE
jgi:hypothetical protein